MKAVDRLHHILACVTVSWVAFARQRAIVNA